MLPPPPAQMRPMSAYDESTHRYSQALGVAHLIFSAETTKILR
jgi:hypothetical protein